jgi:hypothetical protein
MYDAGDRTHALELVAMGASLSDISRTTGVARSTIRSWALLSGPVVTECCRCEGSWPAAGAEYAALLGFYLGDGCVSTFGTHTTLRVSCDAAWPGIISDVSRLVRAVHPAWGVFHVRAPGAIVVQGNWKHWPCLFPQHGPGRKHERAIGLAAWQEEIVTAFPAHFLRGLFHSDGARVKKLGDADGWRGEAPLRIPEVAVQQPLRQHPRAVLLGPRPGRGRVATVGTVDDLRLSTGGGRRTRWADRTEVLIQRGRR